MPAMAAICWMNSARSGMPWGLSGTVGLRTLWLGLKEEEKEDDDEEESEERLHIPRKSTETQAAATTAVAQRGPPESGRPLSRLRQKSQILHPIPSNRCSLDHGIKVVAVDL